MNSFRQSLAGRPGSNIPRPTSSLAGSNAKSLTGSHHQSSSRTATETYHFPLLKPQAIVSCLTDIQISWTEEELARPTPQKMLLVYETFLDMATESARDDCSLDEIQDMDITNYPEFIVDAVRFYIFLYQLTTMMYDVGVPDFSSRDLTKPEAERVRRVLSAVINYAKFKEDRQGPIYEDLRPSDQVIGTISELEKDFRQLSEDIEISRQRRQAQEPKVEETKIVNQNLAMEMEVLKKQEAQTTRHKDEVARERHALNEKNKELSAAVEKANKELEQQRLQQIHVPETLEPDLIQIPESIASLQAQVEQHRRQVQISYSSVERIESIPREMSTILEMMNDTLEMLEKLQREALQADSVKSQIEKKRLEASTLETKLKQNERQTKGLEEKFKALNMNQQPRRAQQEAELTDQERIGLEIETKLLESRRVLEERRRKHAEVLQREEKFSQDATAALEKLKHQFECYTTEVLQAMRLN
ncbi:kinetochore-associated Ndc80 complex subunit nuf2 [Mortierella sp. AD011]|nr:kinetochore-associated Ndc80 complex subunit nuf2 [Mortierella sp. AD010]KAF9401147.1 kinetochore-associated Ndc80 complex subunit nuf2 [Mortierella sp. AD011]